MYGYAMVGCTEIYPRVHVIIMNNKRTELKTGEQFPYKIKQVFVVNGETSQKELDKILKSIPTKKRDKALDVIAMEEGEKVFIEELKKLSRTYLKTQKVEDKHKTCQEIAKVLKGKSKKLQQKWLIEKHVSKPARVAKIKKQITQKKQTLPFDLLYRFIHAAKKVEVEDIDSSKVDIKKEIYNKGVQNPLDVLELILEHPEWFEEWFLENNIRNKENIEIVYSREGIGVAPSPKTVAERNIKKPDGNLVFIYNKKWQLADSIADAKKSKATLIIGATKGVIQKIYVLIYT